MQAVIFCGGFGSRLGSKTKIFPKPILKINNIPFLSYIIRDLQRYGIKEVLLLTYYKHEKIVKFIKNSKFENIKITTIKEKKKSGTAGSLINAKKYLRKEFFLLNGDTFFNFNILDLKKKFRLRKNICFAMALSANSKKRFTKISIEKKSKLLIEPKKNSNFINAGFYYVSKKIFNFMSKNDFSLEDEVFPKLIKKKQAIGIQYLNKRNLFIDIGVPSDLKKSQSVLKKIFNKKTIFLDRDGVINYDYGYVHSRNKFVWKKNIMKFIKFLNDNDFYIIVISNQSGVGRGYYSINKVFKLHEWINKELNTKGSHIDDFFIATYFKNSKKYSSLEELKRRKPNTGMIDDATRKWKINKNKSLLIGDQLTDIQAAKNSNIKHSILLNDPNILKVLDHKFFK